MVTVSIIVPTLVGREHLLKTAIYSVLNQTFQDFEIIIVSNGKLALGISDPRIRVIVSPEANVSRARNIGIASARGKYIAFLDDDDFWLPTKLEKQVTILDSMSHVGLVHTLFFKKYPSGKVVPNKVKVYDGDVFDKLLLRNFIGTSTVVIRKEVIRDVDGFDENLVIAEDWDLWLRISQETEIVHIPEYLVYYAEPSNMIRKYLSYFKGFRAFIQKWKNVVPINAHVTHILIWMWYGKSAGIIPSLEYWRYKSYLVLPGDKSRRVSRIYSKIIKKYF